MDRFYCSCFLVVSQLKVWWSIVDVTCLRISIYFATQNVALQHRIVIIIFSFLWFNVIPFFNLKLFGKLYVFIFQATSDVLRCLRPRCHMTSHTLCLARSFLGDTSDQLLPIDGQCPACETHLLWGDLIRFKLGCYRNLAQVDNHHTHLSCRVGHYFSHPVFSILCHFFSQLVFLHVSLLCSGFPGVLDFLESPWILKFIVNAWKVLEFSCFCYI